MGTDVRTPTRLGEPQTTFRLARIDDGRVVPWYHDQDRRRAWALSEVSVRTARLAGAPEDAAVGDAKQDWPGWDRDIPVLLLRPDGSDRWASAGVDPRGKKRRVTYDASYGLVLSREGA